MPEITTVVTGETIASQWGNDIRDRTVQRYADAAERTTEHPTPTQGDLSFLVDTGDVDVYASGGWQHIGVPTGAITMWGTASPPAGWLLLNGQAISRTTYAALFAEYGTTYGVGDGSTTFNLPDLRQRFPLGKAASGTGAALGDTGGAIPHFHNGPSHSHTNPNVNSSGVHSHGGSTGADAPPRNVAFGIDDDVAGDNHTHPISADGVHAHTQNNTGAAGTGNTGPGDPPYIALNFIIKT